MTVTMRLEEVSIREAVVEDLDVLKSFEQGIIEYERPFAPNLKPDPISYYDIQALIERKDALLLVACIGSKIVGSGYYLIEKAKPYKTPDHYAYLGFMHVLPEYRGHGINGKILQSLIDGAKAEGITEFQLDVYAENDSAIRAYTKIGFKPSLVNMMLATEED